MCGLLYMYSSISQYAKDFYIAQWIYDTQVELEKVLKDPSLSTLDDIDPLESHMEVSSSDLALQQSEMKSDMLRSLLGKKRSSLKALESVLDDKRAAIVTRSLASYRALSKSFDMYLQNVCNLFSFLFHPLHTQLTFHTSTPSQSHIFTVCALHNMYVFTLLTAHTHTHTHTS